MRQRSLFFAKRLACTGHARCCQTVVTLIDCSWHHHFLARDHYNPTRDSSTNITRYSSTFNIATLKSRQHDATHCCHSRRPRPSLIKNNNKTNKRTNEPTGAQVSDARLHRAQPGVRLVLGAAAGLGCLECLPHHRSGGGPVGGAQQQPPV